MLFASIFILRCNWWFHLNFDDMHIPCKGETITYLGSNCLVLGYRADCRDFDTYEECANAYALKYIMIKVQSDDSDRVGFVNLLDYNKTRG